MQEERGGLAMSHGERGESKIPLILMILLLAAIIFVLIKVVPPRVNAYEFKDFMDSYARNESWQRDEEGNRKDLLDKANSLGLPIKPENITVERRGSRIKLRAVFDVPVDLKVKTWVLHYDFTEDAEHY
jgi:hypothetical protein